MYERMHACIDELMIGHACGQTKELIQSWNGPLWEWDCMACLTGSMDALMDGWGDIWMGDGRIDGWAD